MKTMDEFDESQEDKASQTNQASQESQTNEEKSASQEDPKEKEKKVNKPTSHRFIAGIFLGVILTVVIGIGSLYVISYLTGKYFVIKAPSNVELGNEILDKDSMSKLNELKAYMDLYYYEDYDAKDVKNSMYAGVVNGLGDQYSTYYSKSEYKDFMKDSTGKYCGIGAALMQDQKTKKVTVSKVYDGTPAKEAGIKEGDEIVKVGEYKADKLELTKLVKKIQGKENTKVTIEALRVDTKERYTVDVTRKSIQLPSIESQMLEGNIGYIKIIEFQQTTDEQFVKSLEELKAQGAQKFIFDVRDNPGGVLDSVVNILDHILPKGTVVYTKDKYGHKMVKKSDGKNELKCPITVLVNGNSASASEIFAGAIKDYKKGTLIGEKTFGKGIVQTIFPLEDGDAIKITTAKYFTPKGNYIHGKGIKPDINLKYDKKANAESYDIKKDNQVNKAIEVLNEK